MGLGPGPTLLGCKVKELIKEDLWTRGPQWGAHWTSLRLGGGLTGLDHPFHSPLGIPARGNQQRPEQNSPLEQRHLVAA